MTAAISDVESWEFILSLSARLAREGFLSIETRLAATAVADKILNERDVKVYPTGFDFSKPNADGGFDVVGCAFSRKGEKISNFFVVHLAVDADHQPVSLPVFISAEAFKNSIGCQKTLSFFENRKRFNVMDLVKGKKAASGIMTADIS